MAQSNISRQAAMAEVEGKPEVRVAQLETDAIDSPRISSVPPKQT